MEVDVELELYLDSSFKSLKNYLTGAGRCSYTSVQCLTDGYYYASIIALFFPRSSLNGTKEEDERGIHNEGARGSDNHRICFRVNESKKRSRDPGTSKCHHE